MRINEVDLVKRRKELSNVHPPKNLAPTKMILKDGRKLNFGRKVISRETTFEKHKELPIFDIVPTPIPKTKQSVIGDSTNQKSSIIKTPDFISVRELMINLALAESIKGEKLDVFYKKLLELFHESISYFQTYSSNSDSDTNKSFNSSQHFSPLVPDEIKEEYLEGKTKEYEIRYLEELDAGTKSWLIEDKLRNEGYGENE